MDASTQVDVNYSASLRGRTTLSNRHFVLAVFAGLIVLQVLVYLTLGTDRLGRGISALILVADNVLAIACAWSTFRRSRSIAAIFWFLYSISLLILLVPMAVGAIDTLFARSLLPLSVWRALFCLYGAPILMMLFLPDTYLEHGKVETVLDMLQVLIVVGLAFSTFLLLPVQQMLPSEALRRNVTLSNLQSLVLLLAIGVRLLIARLPETRDLFVRLGIFVLACATVTWVGNWIDVHESAVFSAWFDLGWALPLVAGSTAAAGWSSWESEPSGCAKPRLIGFLLSNFVLVILLCLCVAMLTGPWAVVNSGLVTGIAVGVSLVAFTGRLSLTQYHQEKEIAQRITAEEELQKIASIVDSSEDAIIGWDAEGIITNWNPAAEKMYGYTRAEALNQNIRLLVPLEKRTELMTMMEQIRSGEPISTVETQRSTKSGAILDVALTVSPMRNTGGRVVGASTIARNITIRKRAEEQLKLQAAALDAAANGIMITDRRGTIVWANRAFSTLTGYSAEEVYGKNARILKSGVQPEKYYADLWSTISAGEVWKGEITNRRRDGTLYKEEMAITPVTPELGQTTETYFIAIKQDITARKQAEEVLLFKNALLEAEAETTLDGILVVDEFDHIILVNKQLGVHLGIPDDILSKRDDQVVLQHLVPRVKAPEAFVEKVQYLYSHREERSWDEFELEDGKVFDRYSAPLVDSAGRYRGRVWYFRDITGRKRSAERAQYLAYYDALTGLPNRALFHEHLKRALAHARREHGKVALLFLDLDGFKNINDSLGHSIGDLLLQEVAQRLKKWSRAEDTVARFGGDEFLILLTEVDNFQDTAAAAERLMDALTAEIRVQGNTLNISCSVGISIFPDHGQDEETLISNADTAMYNAKESGRNNFQSFTQDMNAQLVERVTLQSSLRHALEKNELFIVYQPQMDIATGKINGLEALLRWQHPTMGLVPPDKFIPIAEDSGLILPIGEWVLRTVCRQAKQWQEEGLVPLPVAVNISAVQFRQENFCTLIKQVLNEADLAPKYLDLELTESILLANADMMLSVVHEIKAMGLGIAIDDFGTGYSSFSYLRQFGANKLKIDRSFIQDVAVKADDAAIAAAIISMAKSLNLKVIAEGVENYAQLSFLRAQHCDEIQGYYFSKPLTADKVPGKIREAALGAWHDPLSPMDEDGSRLVTMLPVDACI